MATEGTLNEIESQKQGSVASITQKRATKFNAIKIPKFFLQKVGGALKDIDEKFEVSAANGTADFYIFLPIMRGLDNRGLLQSENFKLEESSIPAITDIQYNEKELRTRIQSGNDTVTRNQDDRLTYGLLLLRTTSDRGSILHQELHYTYDASDNTRDDAYGLTFLNYEGGYLGSERILEFTL